MKKNNYFLLIILALTVAFGCSKKTENKDSLTKSEEFFKEIEAPVLEQSAQLNATVPDKVLLNKEQTPSGVSEAPLKPADLVPVNPSIKDVQRALTNAKLYKGKMDGVSGPQTRKAVEEFQTRNKLKVDGKVGPATWRELQKYYNVSL